MKVRLAITNLYQHYVNIDHSRCHIQMAVVLVCLTVSRPGDVLSIRSVDLKHAYLWLLTVLLSNSEYIYSRNLCPHCCSGVY